MTSTGGTYNVHVGAGLLTNLDQLLPPPRWPEDSLTSRCIGGNWPSEPNYKQTGSSDYRYYLNGEIAAITYSFPGGP